LFENYLRDVDEGLDALFRSVTDQIESDQHSVEQVATNVVQFSQDKLADLQFTIGNL
jgi:hypothetical protein